jgi:Carbamoyltransferase C-terminus
LLVEFGRLTGVPVLINTSFNEQEPIVTTPAEAIACFLRTDMDVLVLGNCHVARAAFALPRSHAAAGVVQSAHPAARPARTAVSVRTLGADGATS